MNRLILLLIIGGICLAGWGIDEFRKAPDGPGEPVKVELADLEKTGSAPSTYLEIGAHSCRYDESLTYGKVGKDGRPQNDRVDWVMYPIVAVAAAGKEKDSGKGAPLRFSVMVKTTRIKKRSDIPTEILNDTSVTGRVLSVGVNFTTTLADQIRSSYAGIDVDKLIIIDDGVSPSAARMEELGKIAGGVALFVLGVGVVLYRRRKTAAPAARVTPPKPPADDRDALPGPPANG